MNKDARHHRRNRVLKRATIISSLQKSEIGCVVRNQSDGGAELIVATEAPVPGEFLLYVPADGVAYRCVLRWRRHDRAGVEFVGIEPKPAFHYG